MADRACGAVWADVTGRTRLTIIKGATNPCTIVTQLQAVSNAQVLFNWDGPIDPTIGVAVAATYEGVAQWAQLVFQTAAGSILKLTFPAPQLGVFKADKQTIDPTLIAALIAACIGQLSDGSGNVATAYLGGTLQPTPSDITPIG